MGQKEFVHRTLSLDDIKLVKNVMNMTINDVLLGVTTAGLSSYLNRRYGMVKKNDQGATEKKNNLPKDIRLRSTLLVNMRPSSSLYYMCSFKLSISCFISPKILSNTTMSCSNLIGPLEEIGFYGHPMAYLAPTFYGHPQVLTINYQSYINKMIIILAVDETAIPDPHKLCDDLEESLKLIKDAILAKHEHITLKRFIPKKNNAYVFQIFLYMYIGFAFCPNNTASSGIYVSMISLKNCKSFMMNFEYAKNNSQ
ncbi:hypothetical protein MKW92_019980 [Papaver armeniacum]|nr:hypothetical protein MKW92_019980 [Papaver armeniacum]